MKFCELCKGLARTYCESDNASLCWACDMKVHSANFLAARHSRSLLCHMCQSPTAWSATGAKLGKTVSVCDRCVDGYYHRDEMEESGSVNNEQSSTEDEESEYEEDDEADEDEVDSEDIQVVPWSTTPPPPPPASSSSSEDSSNVLRNVCSKRMREADEDLHSDDGSKSSLCQRKVADRLTAPGSTPVLEFIKRNNNRQRMNSNAAIAELCTLNDDSRTVDLETSETS